MAMETREESVEEYRDGQFVRSYSIVVAISQRERERAAMRAMLKGQVTLADVIGVVELLVEDHGSRRR